MALIKFFSEEKHYLAFKNGYSLFRTPHYFRKCEGLGRGDKTESCLGYWDKELGNKMPSLVVNGEKIETGAFKSLLIYPAREQQDSWLQSWCVMGADNSFDESLERMLEEFGAYFVIIPAKHIKTYANLVSQASGNQVHYGVVRYSKNPLDLSLTVKDSNFSYQKEFRFYLGRCDKGEIEDKEVCLPGVRNILLEANSLRLESPSGEVSYCSLGRKGVVLARL